jgi:endo-1,4-beta-xylanase
LRALFQLISLPSSCPTAFTSAPLAPCPVSLARPPAAADVPATSPAYNAVTYLVSTGALSSVQDGRFLPDRPATRGEAISLLVRAFGLHLGQSTGAHFRDVPPGNALYPAVEAAYAAGLIHGYPDGTFRPASPITRGEIARLMVEAAGWPLSRPAPGPFRDVPAASPF